MTGNLNPLHDPRNLVASDEGERLRLTLAGALCALPVSPVWFTDLCRQWRGRRFTEVWIDIATLPVLTSDIMSGIMVVQQRLRSPRCILAGVSHATYERLQVVGLTHLFEVRFRDDEYHDPSRLRHLADNATQRSGTLRRSP